MSFILTGASIIIVAISNLSGDSSDYGKLPTGQLLTSVLLIILATAVVQFWIRQRIFLKFPRLKLSINEYEVAEYFIHSPNNINSVIQPLLIAAWIVIVMEKLHQQHTNTPHSKQQKKPTTANQSRRDRVPPKNWFARLNGFYNNEYILAATAADCACIIRKELPGARSSSRQRLA